LTKSANFVEYSRHGGGGQGEEKSNAGGVGVEGDLQQAQVKLFGGEIVAAV